MFGLYFLGKGNVTMGISKEEYYGVSEDDCVTIDLSDIMVSDITISVDDASLFGNTTISSNTMFSDDIIFTSADGEETKVLEELKNQRLQIAVLTDMITEMIEQLNFDIKWDIEQRIEQKKFLEKLSR